MNCARPPTPSWCRSLARWRFYCDATRRPTPICPTWSATRTSEPSRTSEISTAPAALTTRLTAGSAPDLFVRSWLQYQYQAGKRDHQITEQLPVGAVRQDCHQEEDTSRCQYQQQHL